MKLQYDVGVYANGFYPVSIEQVKRFLKVVYGLDFEKRNSGK